MIILTQEDIDVLIKDEHLQQITGGDNDVFRQSEKAAWAEMKGYLRVRFDTDLIFQNFADYDLLRVYLVDMTIYHTVARITPRNIPEVRYCRYKDAVQYLKMAANNEISPDLPEYEELDCEGNPVDIKTGTGMQIGGKGKENWQY